MANRPQFFSIVSWLLLLSTPPGPTHAQPSWDDLRIFLAVVAHGSLNSAGRALGQSQPTVARRMRVLEDLLGVALFERGRTASR